MNVLEVKFIGDGDALEHIVDKQEGMNSSHVPSPACIFVFVSVRLTTLSRCLCSTTRCAEQKWLRPEDGDVEEPCKTKGSRGNGTRRG